MRDVIAPSDAGDADSKWKQLADLALAKSDLKLAKECQEAVGDASGLLLLYAATGNPDGMRRLADMAAKQGRANIEFICRFLTADVEGAIEVLKKADRLPEVCGCLPSRSRQGFDTALGFVFAAGCHVCAYLFAI